MSAPLETRGAVGSGEGPEGPEESRLPASTRPASMAPSLLARSLRACGPSACPPAACLPDACSHSPSPSRLSPLTPEVASQPMAGAPARMCAPSAQPHGSGLRTARWGPRFLGGPRAKQLGGRAGGRGVLYGELGFREIRQLLDLLSAPIPRDPPSAAAPPPGRRRRAPVTSPEEAGA